MIWIATFVGRFIEKNSFGFGLPPSISLRICLAYFSFLFSSSSLFFYLSFFLSIFLSFPIVLFPSGLLPHFVFFMSFYLGIQGLEGIEGPDWGWWLIEFRFDFFGSSNSYQILIQVKRRRIPRKPY